MRSGTWGMRISSVANDNLRALKPRLRNPHAESSKERPPIRRRFDPPAKAIKRAYVIYLYVRIYNRTLSEALI